MAPVLVNGPVKCSACAMSETAEARLTSMFAAELTCSGTLPCPARTAATESERSTTGLVYTTPPVPGTSVPNPKLSVPVPPGATCARIGSCAEVHVMLLSFD